MSKGGKGAGGYGGFFGPGERTIISIITEITIVWLAGWGISAAWFIGWASVYAIGPLFYVWWQMRAGVAWGIWDNVQGWYNLNWAGLLGWWLVGVPLSTSTLVYRFFMENVFKDWLPHPEKPEVVYVENEQDALPTPTESHRHVINHEDGSKHIIGGEWEDHNAIVNFAKAITGGKNFSVSVSRRYGVTPADYDTLKDRLLTLECFEKKSIGPKRTLKLKAKGRANLRGIGDTPTP